MSEGLQRRESTMITRGALRGTALQTVQTRSAAGDKKSQQVASCSIAAAAGRTNLEFGIWIRARRRQERHTRYRPALLSKEDVILECVQYSGTLESVVNH